MQKPARILVLIEQDGNALARLYDDEMRLVSEFDASSEEVATMTTGLQPLAGATDPRWDRALQGHSPTERAAAQVYALDV